MVPPAYQNGGGAQNSSFHLSGTEVVEDGLVVRWKTAWTLSVIYIKQINFILDG